MSSHYQPELPIDLKEVITSVMNQTKISDADLNFNAFVALYITDWDYFHD